jgi:hypothetical protein
VNAYTRYGGTPLRFLVHRPYSDDRAEILDLLLEHGADPHLVEPNEAEAIVDTLRENRYGLFDKNWVMLFEKKGILTAATQDGDAESASVANSAPIYANIEESLAAAQKEAVQSRATKCRRLSLQEQLGHPVIAWSTPDDGTRFDTDKARSILNKHLAFLGFTASGAFVGGDPADSQCCCWFFAYQQKPQDE